MEIYENTWNYKSIEYWKFALYKICMNRYTTFKCINKYVKHIFKSIYLYIRYIEIKMEAVKKLLNECMLFFFPHNCLPPLGQTLGCICMIWRPGWSGVHLGLHMIWSLCRCAHSLLLALASVVQGLETRVRLTWESLAKSTDFLVFPQHSSHWSISE